MSNLKLFEIQYRYNGNPEILVTYVLETHKDDARSTFAKEYHAEKPDVYQIAEVSIQKLKYKSVVIINPKFLVRAVDEIELIV